MRLDEARPRVHVPGLEAIGEEGLRRFRKRVPLGRNFEALESARSLDITVAININAPPTPSRPAPRAPSGESRERARAIAQTR